MSNENFSLTWLDTLTAILDHGDLVQPRGKWTREIPHLTMLVDMRQPVLMVPFRKMSYRFMAAEAYWILSGDNRVETIAPYNSRIAEFSDNGHTFYGAYGPRIKSQIDYVVSKLCADPETRQAGLTIWQENPPATKDYPCTIAVFFSIRNQLLNAHVFMRSSDVWLGIPYDVFNFSMLSHQVCALVNAAKSVVSDHTHTIKPGSLYLTAASSHLYEENWDEAEICMRSDVIVEQPDTPDLMHEDPLYLLEILEALKDTTAGDSRRWWEHHASYT